MKVRSKKVTYRQRKARATSSLRDARGAELKRVGVKESIRIGLRRGIPCVIRREPRDSLQKIRRGTRVRNKERTDQGEKSHPLCYATSYILDLKATMSIAPFPPKFNILAIEFPRTRPDSSLSSPTFILLLLLQFFSLLLLEQSRWGNF